MPPRLLVDQLLHPWLRQGAAADFRLPGVLGPGARLLVLDDGDLADLAFHAPLLQGLREGFPGLVIDVLLPAAHVPLAAASGLVRECLVYSPGQLRMLSPGFFTLLRSVRGRGYSAAIVTSHAPRPALEMAALASGAPLRLGPSHPGSYPAVNFEVRRPAGDRSYYGRRPAAALPYLGLRPAPAGWRWPLPEERVRQVRQLVRFNKPRPDDLLVGVDPAAGKAGAALSLQNLSFVIGQLVGQVPCQVVPLSAGDEERLREFTATLRTPPPALPRGDLLETALVLSQCDLFLAGNTDLFHLAVALDVPAIGLFTAADEVEWEPTGRAHARAVRVARGERVDVETLMAAVEGVGVRRPGLGMDSGTRGRAGSVAGGEDDRLAGGRSTDGAG